MRCEDIQDLLPLYPVELLDAEEKAAVLKHLESGCPRCTAELAAFGTTLSLLPLVLTPEEPRPAVKLRLMAKLRKERDVRPARPPRAPAPAPPPRTSRALPWVLAAAACVAVAVISILLTASVIRGRDAAETTALRRRIDEQGKQLARQSEEMASLKVQVRDARESIQLVSSPGVAVIDLEGQGSAKPASARVFWDRTRSFWQVYVSNLPPAGAARTHQLWFITATAKISAGTFETDPAGEGSHRVEIPKGVGAVVATAVTDEPVGGSPQPTGSILLLGKI
jgi:hypothetical protein